MNDYVWKNVTLVTMAGDDYGLLENGALVVEAGRIAWLGLATDLPAAYHSYKQKDGGGGCLAPGLIDCHTHVVYGGDRSDEFAARLSGVSYADIAKAGGGIQKTVRATRDLSESALYAESLPRVQALMAGGVTTLEVKSGYGLDWQTERKQLRVAKQLAADLSLRVVTTFLGAHTVPPEYQGRADAYIDLVCQEMIPCLAEENLATIVDAFCEHIAFDTKQVRRVFAAAKAHGLQVKLHAEQLSSMGAARLAAEFSALSVDHCEYLTEADVAYLAEKGSVCVLLPGAYYFLRETQKPPINWLREYQVPIALATDCNPGSSPTTSLPLMMNMACTFWGMTPLETWQAVTLHAAKALGLQEEIGSLQVGKAAEFSLWPFAHPDTLAYEFGSQRAVCQR